MFLNLQLINNLKMSKINKNWLDQNLRENYNNTVKNYEEAFYYIINNTLRKGIISNRIYNWIQQIVDEIDKSTPYPDYLEVYRGVRHESYANLNIGDVFDDLGFVSTTMSETHAKSISTVALLTILWKPGNKFIYLKNEQEILTYPGVRFEVIDVSTFQRQALNSRNESNNPRFTYIELPHIYVKAVVSNGNYNSQDEKVISIYNSTYIKSIIDHNLDVEYDAKYPIFNYNNYELFISEKLGILSDD
jgi:hypothetical protein